MAERIASTPFPSVATVSIPSDSRQSHAALHELAHAMGKTSGYSPYGILDLIRYSAPGVHAYAGGTPAYFSVNGGVTDLGNWSTTSDYGDFASDNLTVHDPFDAYISAGSNALTAVDLINLDAIGFTLAGSGGTPPPPPANQPDLTVSSASLKSASVVQGANLNLAYLIADIGNGAAGASSAQVLIDGKVVSTDAIAALAAGGSATVNDVLSTAGLTAGAHTITINANSTGSVSESSTANNSTTLSFNVTAPPPPPSGADLVISSLTDHVFAPARFQAGSVSFSFTVADIGTAAAGSEYAGVYLDGKANPALTRLINALPAGGSTTLSGSLSTAGLSHGVHTLTVVADYRNTVAESNEGNNSRSVTFKV